MFGAPRLRFRLASLFILGGVALAKGASSDGELVLAVDRLPGVGEDMVVRMDVEPGDAGPGKVLASSPALHRLDDGVVGAPVPVSFVSSGDGQGTLFWRVSGQSAMGSPQEFVLKGGGGGGPTEGVGEGGVTVERDGSKLIVRNGSVEVTHDADRGGMITSIAYGAKAEVPLKIEMRDSLVVSGSRLTFGGADAVELSVLGEPDDGSAALALIVEAEGEFTHPGGQNAGRDARAVYRYIYTAGSPLVRVEVDLPRQQAAGNLELFVLDFGKESPFASSVSIRPDGNGILVPEQFPWDPAMARPSGGLLLKNASEALAVITPLAPSYRYDLDKGEAYLDSRTFGEWNGESVRASAMIWYGPVDDAVGEVALASPYVVRAEVPAISQRIAVIAERAKAQGESGSATLLMSLASAAGQRAARLCDLEMADALLSAAEDLKGSSGQGVAVLDQPEFFLVANSATGLLFMKENDQVTLGGLFGSDGHAFIDPTSLSLPPLWSATLVDTETDQTVLADLAGAEAFDFRVEGAGGDTTEIVLNWQGVPAGEGRVGAEARIRVSAAEPLSAWRINVKPDDQRMAVWEVGFPLVHLAPDSRSSASDYAIAPFKTGTTMPAPATAGTWRLDYPGEAGWAFLAYWQGDQGFYFGAHDPNAAVKGVNTFATGDGSIEFAFHVPPPNQGVGGEPFEMGYSVRLGAYRGNWFEAAQIYRSFLEEQEWFPQKKLADREDIPSWIKEVVVAQRRSGIPLAKDEFANASDPEGLGPVNESRLLGSPPTLLWWYHGWGPVDEDGTPKKGPQQNTPFHMFPPDFAAVYKKLKEAPNMRVILYTLFSWWDANHESFTPEAEAALLQIRPGKTSSSEKDGGQIVLMCPATEFYQKGVVAMAERLFSKPDLIPDGTYFDLSATSAGLYCFDPNHGHPVGGGWWRTEAVRKVIRIMRETGRKKNPEFVVVSEGNADCYLTELDGWIAFAANTPVRQVLYADYVRSAGDKRTELFNRKPDPELGFTPMAASNAAKNFAWGTPIGRFIGIELWTYLWKGGKEVGGEKIDANIEYFRNLVALKWVAGEWLNFGQMVKPLDLLKITPVDPPGALIGESVPHATWVSRDGAVAFVFANSRLDEAVSFSYSLDVADYGLPVDGSHALYRLTPRAGDGVPVPIYEEVAQLEGVSERQETLPPGGALILVAKAKSE